MRASRDGEGLATTLAAMVEPEADVADILAHLLIDCARETGAEAAALLARDAAGELVLLSAASHRAVELEMHQTQGHEGPCVDVITEGAALRTCGQELLQQRWGSVGASIVQAGFHSVEGYPLRWRGTPFGGLNLFWTDAEPVIDRTGTRQAYADVATLVVMHTRSAEFVDRETSLLDALEGRELIEQAKGVLAHRRRISLEDAYAILLGRAGQAGNSLTRAARDVVTRRG